LFGKLKGNKCADFHNLVPALIFMREKVLPDSNRCFSKRIIFRVEDKTEGKDLFLQP
jgi:hypothetical protein